MKESAIYRAFAGAVNIIALVALFAVLLGHEHHLFTLFACSVLGIILNDEAIKSDAVC